MPKRRWTKATLKAELRRLVKSPRTSVTLGRMDPCSARVDWEEGRNGRLTIRIDPEREGLVRCTIHELLHFVLREPMAATYSDPIEEELILALERHIYDGDVMRSPGQLLWWRRAIQGKLASEADA